MSNQQIATRPAYRVDEVAKMFGVSETTIYRAIEAGQIKAVRLAKRTIVIPANEIDAVLNPVG